MEYGIKNSTAHFYYRFAACPPSRPQGEGPPPGNQRKAGYFVIDKVPGRVTVTVSNLAEGGDKTTTFFIHQQPL